jgi:hypothetical protein
MPESVDEVLSDLRRMLDRAAATQAFSNYGLAEVDRRVAAGPRSPDNPDPTVYIGLGDPNDPVSKQYAKFKASELPALLAKGGPISRQLGQQWAVFVFTEWENNFRRRLSALHGCVANSIQAGVFGDLRLIRHDILHNRALASAERTARCEVLHWFQPGDEIAINAENIAQFMELVPWDALKEGPAAG